MSDNVWIAAIAAVAPTLAVILATRSQDKKAAKATAVITEKVDEVHALANDRLTKALDRIEALNLVVERLSSERSQ